MEACVMVKDRVLHHTGFVVGIADPVSHQEFKSRPRS